MDAKGACTEPSFEAFSLCVPFSFEIDRKTFTLSARPIPVAAAAPPSRDITRSITRCHREEKGRAMRRVWSRKRARTRVCWRPREGTFFFRPPSSVQGRSQREPLRFSTPSPPPRRIQNRRFLSPLSTNTKDLLVVNRLPAVKWNWCAVGREKSAEKVSFCSFRLFFARVHTVRGSINSTFPSTSAPPRAPLPLRSRPRSRIEINRRAKDSHTEGRGLGGLGADRDGGGDGGLGGESEHHFCWRW